VRTVTERVLSEALASLIAQDGWGRHYPCLGCVAEEIVCQQGRPDLVASACPVRNGLSDAEIVDAAAVLGSPAAARVVSLLKPGAGRTIGYLARCSGLSIRTVRDALRTLLEVDLAVSSENGCFLLGEKLIHLDRELWAFEVKVDNWQRALFQALQYRAFADRVAVAMASDYVHRVRPRVGLFRSLRIGLLAIDASERSVEVVLPPFKSPPASRFHRFQALGRFLTALRENPARMACTGW
jgi:hypothetical protein